MLPKQMLSNKEPRVLYISGYFQYPSVCSTNRKCIYSNTLTDLMETRQAGRRVSKQKCEACSFVKALELLKLCLNYLSHPFEEILL